VKLFEASGGDDGFGEDNDMTRVQRGLLMSWWKESGSFSPLGFFHLMCKYGRRYAR